METSETNETSYDQVPYKSFPFRQCHPDRLATIAALHGLSGKPINESRILEIGCASGGNLLPIADRYPGSQCVGIDLSSRQIELGESIRKAANLHNAELRVADIRSFGDGEEPFDYIISHGVYSWIPDEAQEALLACCRKLSSACGLAYISYNTNPGWRMRGMIRDLMAYHSRNIRSSEDRVRKARAILHFLSETVPTEDNPYGMLLNQELEGLQDKEDYYLLHEHLEEHNEPVYFWQFIERAARHGLQYVGEADYSAMSIENFSPTIVAMLRNLAADIVETEQYMDFVRNRMFRQTILCSTQRRVDRAVSARKIAKLHVASDTEPQQPITDIRSDEQVVFQSGKSITKTNNPMVKAALCYLREKWPQFVSFPELISVARSRSAGAISMVDKSTDLSETDRFGLTLLRCYATGQVELSQFPPALATSIDASPTVSPLTRVSAKLGDRVTNLRHETVRLNDIERRIVQQLDGTRSREDVIESVVSFAESGDIIVYRDGEAVVDTESIRGLAQQVVDQALKRLCKQMLLG
jgi:methyltransferase-like protein/2-polyprenyl-3-methyl-5-hydroxy-6-metoxy-1,4-benzoquinol methylase